MKQVKQAKHIGTHKNSKKQVYKKKENLPINKQGLIEITGNRTELKEYLGQVLNCYVFVTNTTKYGGIKRLITEVRIPGTNYYINHLWTNEINLPLNKVPHGYQTIKLKVISYKDVETGETKYGIEVAETKYRKLGKQKKKMVIPKWKKEMMEEESLIRETKAEKLLKNAKVINSVKDLRAAKGPKQPFGKIRVIKKAQK